MKSTNSLLINSKLISCIFFLISLLFISCYRGSIEDEINNIISNKIQPSGIVIQYPKDGTIFPPEFFPPEFLWKDTINQGTKWHIFASTKEGKELFSGTVEEPKWRPDSALWSKIKSESTGLPVCFTFIGEGKGFFKSTNSSGITNISTSLDSVGASIFYRAVPLPFIFAAKNVHLIEWYSGKVNGSKPQKMLDKMPVCANCHSFSKNGSTFAMDVDYANDKGSYVIGSAQDTLNITPDKIITWSDYKRDDGERTFGLLSNISPDGNYVLSTVKDLSVFVPRDNDLEYSQLFFPIKGIIAVYDRVQKKFYELAGASDKSYVQSNPSWSPDGKEVIFARADVYLSEKVKNSKKIILNPSDAEEFLSGKKDFKFNLYKVDFNDGKGGIAKPLAGASENGKSNYFARYSPDGKWIVFCQANNFMLLQRDSRLFIVPAQGGTPRLMNCNSGKMNSWHSWSPNSKWIVYSSKSQGPYTQLYLTHIDENGNDSPPVFLENLRFENKAANIPEFFNDKGNNFKQIADKFSQTANFYCAVAFENINDKLYKTALKNIEKGFSLDSAFFDVYANRILLNSLLRQSNFKQDLNDKEIVTKMIEKELHKTPDNVSVLMRRCNLKLFKGDDDGVISDALLVLKLKPENKNAYDLMLSVYRKKGQWQKALSHYEKMLELFPSAKRQILYRIALTNHKLGKYDKALNTLDQLIKEYPDDANLFDSRALIFAEQGKKDVARTDYDKAVSIVPEYFDVYLKRAEFLLQTGSKDLAKKDYEKAITLLSNDYEKNTEDIDILFNRAEILEKIGRINEALEDYDNILKMWPLNYSALKQKAKICLNLQSWKQAIDAYELLINNYPAESEFYNNQALAYLRLGDTNKAMVDFDKTVDLDPQNYETLYNRGKLKQQTGDKAGAKTDLQKVANLMINKKIKGNLNKADQDWLTKLLIELSNMK